MGPDLTFELTPVLLKDLLDAISVAVRRGSMSDANKTRLNQYSLYAAVRKRLPVMPSTFSVTLLRAILEAIMIACTYDDITPPAKVRLKEFHLKVSGLLPVEEKHRQVRMKL